MAEPVSDPTPILRAIADEVITELVARPDVLAEYRAHLDGDVDFVFVEESVSMHLVEADLSEETYQREGCGLVFAWLTAHHDVAAPAWYRLGTGLEVPPGTR